MKVSVVIATKDRARYLERALNSLEQQAGAPAFEAIVADNGSSDETRIVAESCGARGRIGVRYVYEPQPNRGKARNAGARSARGELLLFCDDDVVLPAGWIAAHARAAVAPDLVVSGPIVNVPSHEARPRPTLANASRAFFCTCNVSLPREAFETAGGFDESFDLYGWEDTELGMRLRARGMRRRFAWDAYLWHVKPPDENTLDVETRKAVEKARMAVRFVRKQSSPRARLAAGLHPLNVWRGKLFNPDRLLALYAGAASSARVPAAVRAIARARFLDGMYLRELLRALDE
jgi:glycosyltransferase involved in cell wall biosynthesis